MPRLLLGSLPRTDLPIGLLTRAQNKQERRLIVRAALIRLCLYGATNHLRNLVVLLDDTTPIPFGTPASWQAEWRICDRAADTIAACWVGREQLRWFTPPQRREALLRQVRKEQRQRLRENFRAGDAVETPGAAGDASAKKRTNREKTAQRLRREVMLDDFDFLLDGLGAQAEELEQFCECAVPHLDMLGHRAALDCQRQAAVLFVIHKAARASRRTMVGHRRPAEASEAAMSATRALAFPVHPNS